MRGITAIGRLFLIGAGAMVAVLAAMAAIPHDRYIRWQAVRTEAYARLGWAYERIHFDPTPIDIALIGTSHTMNGLDGLAVARRIAADGTRAPDGRCLTVTNLAIPSYGRNLHWAIARELLGARRPRAIVLEVFENETRKAHPLFSHIADSADLLHAPRLFNINYAADLVRLPYRQLSLGIQSLLPTEFGLKRSFDPGDYDGSTVDNTRIVNVHGQAMSPPLTRVLPPATLARQAVEQRGLKDLNYLPRALEDYEYAMPRWYVPAILAAADRAHVPVYLLYLPQYGQPPRPYDMRPYAGRIMLRANDILARPDYWQDLNHLNAQGAAALSMRLGDRLARLPGLDRAQTGGAACAFGYPERATLRPMPHAAKMID